jgi:hypothetical protein
MTTKKSLPIVGKSLATEILPEPPRSDLSSQPRDRVLRRARELTRGAVLIGAGAGLATGCVDASQTKSQSDPSPIGPASTSGTSGGRAFGGSGVNSGAGGTPGKPMVGFGVVDPLPPPYQCPTRESLVQDTLEGTRARWVDSHVVVYVDLPEDGQSGQILFRSLDSSIPLENSARYAVGGYTFDLRLPGQGADGGSGGADGGSGGAGGGSGGAGGASGGAGAAAPAAGWPPSLVIELTFACEGSPLVPYMITVTLDTSQPAAQAEISVDYEGSDPDGGV